jgi:hypothetical protein
MGEKFTKFLDEKFQDAEVKKWYEFVKNKKDSTEHLAGVIWQSDVMGDSDEEFKDSMKIAERVVNSAWLKARDNAIIALMLDTISAAINSAETNSDPELSGEMVAGMTIALGDITLMRNRLNNMIEDDEGNIVPAWTEDAEETIEQDITVITEGEVQSISADIEPGPHAVAVAEAEENNSEDESEVEVEGDDEEVAEDTEPEESEDNEEEGGDWQDPGGTEEEAAQSTIFEALEAAMQVDEDDLEDEEDAASK